MSKPKLNNWVYRYIQSAVNNALHLEYAIRAAESLYPKQMIYLNLLKEELIAYWLNKSKTLSEIEELKLIDISFDRLQFHSIIIRRNDIYLRFNSSLRVELEKLYDEFIDKYFDIEIAPFKLFRAVDLACGNNILSMYNEAKRCMDISKDLVLKPKDDFELDREYVIREPVHVHPALTFCGSDHFTYEGKFGAYFNLKYDLSAEDLFFTMREFMYQYASWCNADLKLGRWNSRSLVNYYFDNEFFDCGANEVKAPNGLLGPILGLYCYDKRERQKLKPKVAINETTKIHKFTFETMQKRYKNTRKKISQYKNKFKNFPDYY
ncbi:MAG: hypothetical protein A0129_05920 [Limnobacter sp. CACIAM 66H1]|uniref:hypothetical protein n=1 Tax=Limnobacter sp. CACIAM 66H1 TaxID=1813033 RepID=UPI0007A8FD29|nr:hypothetical protein [Limnobacter sp. CACIAM 66H1]KYP11717.1 MAG: hypothetical protein A0129_05920 [Limnobacter sp. CACIAM 66H1]